MTITHCLYDTPDVLPAQRASTETAKLIRKLRWIGKEDEARALERQLRIAPLDERPSVLADPRSTD